MPPRNFNRYDLTAARRGTASQNSTQLPAVAVAQVPAGYDIEWSWLEPYCGSHGKFIPAGLSFIFRSTRDKFMYQIHMLQSVSLSNCQPFSTSSKPTDHLFIGVTRGWWKCSLVLEYPMHPYMTCVWATVVDRQIRLACAAVASSASQSRTAKRRLSDNADSNIAKRQATKQGY